MWFHFKNTIFWNQHFTFFQWILKCCFHSNSFSNEEMEEVAKKVSLFLLPPKYSKTMKQRKISERYREHYLKKKCSWVGHRWQLDQVVDKDELKGHRLWGGRLPFNTFTFFSWKGSEIYIPTNLYTMTDSVLAFCGSDKRSKKVNFEAETFMAHGSEASVHGLLAPLFLGLGAAAHHDKAYSGATNLMAAGGKQRQDRKGQSMSFKVTPMWLVPSTKRPPPQVSRTS